MRIFVSWSGADSRQFAELLRNWIPLVVQEADVFVSSQDIQKGERWSPNIADKLAKIDFGLIALTKSNVSAPWVLFEAGALSKNLDSARLVPILTNLHERDLVKTPLSQFQYCRPDRSSMLDIMRLINSGSERPLADISLEKTFNKWWPDFEERYNEIDFVEASEQETGQPAHSDDLSELTFNILDEVLSEVRGLRNQLKPPTTPPRGPGLLSGLASLGSLPADNSGLFGLGERRQTSALELALLNTDQAGRNKLIDAIINGPKAEKADGAEEQ